MASTDPITPAPQPKSSNSPVHRWHGGQQHLGAEIQLGGAEDAGQCQHGQLGITGLALVAAKPAIQIERGDRFAQLAMIERAAARRVTFDRLFAIGGQQLVGAIDAAAVFTGEEQIGTRFQQGGHHGQQILCLSLGLGHQQQQGIEAGGATELVVEQDSLAEGGLLAAVVAVIGGKDGQGPGQARQLAGVVILQRATDK